MSIFISKIRIKGFRGIEELEVDLSKTTVITGTNNSGKTSFLRALQLVFGNRLNVSFEDFYIKKGQRSKEIIIDTLIIPVDENNKKVEDFSSDWQEIFGVERLQTSDGINSEVPFRTIVTVDENNNTFIRKQYPLAKWYNSLENTKSWFTQNTMKEKSYIFDNIPFFYINAQRDILEDIKSKTSFLGKLISQIKFDEADIKELETLVETLNEKTISKSPILGKIKTSLSEMENTLDSNENNIELTPFTKKIRDISKNISIHLKNENDSFPMEYQGMGTRSWSSLLTLKAFIDVTNDKQDIYYPLVAVEEPEAHLHPNAQKHLYSQINEIIGQKIISTHSPYIAGSAQIEEVRSFYKNSDLKCGKIDVSINSENLRKIKRQVINTRGEIYFSKLLILFEGETEEQALPILAERYFEKQPFELGMNFIGVGGSGNYYPFIKFADDLNIPWFILSDGENSAINDVKSAIKLLSGSPNTVNLDQYDNIFILDNKTNFESYLLENNYSKEIEIALENINGKDYIKKFIKASKGKTTKPVRTKKVCPTCKQNIFDSYKKEYSGDEGYAKALYDCMTAQKTKFGPEIADVLLSSNSPFPPKVEELFNEVKKILKK